MTADDLREKFRGNARLRLRDEAVTRVIAEVAVLPDRAGLRGLLQALAP